MADEELPEESDRAEETKGEGSVPAPSSSARAKGKQGFFTLYKPGQGYWTRVGTYIGAALLALFSTIFLVTHIPVWLNSAGVAAANIKPITIGICAGYLVVFGLVTFALTNRPTNADFLIATDSEMKKVNWTTRKELVGSTKVVILFMLLIAFLLFAFDVVFGYFFQLIGVLQAGPFG
jgi:preprotein translocase SecE subunit